MAGRINRLLVALSLPAIIVVSVYLARKRRRRKAAVQAPPAEDCPAEAAATSATATLTTSAVEQINPEPNSDVRDEKLSNSCGSGFGAHTSEMKIPREPVVTAERDTVNQTSQRNTSIVMEVKNLQDDLSSMSIKEKNHVDQSDKPQLVRIEDHELTSSHGSMSTEELDSSASASPTPAPPVQPPQPPTIQHSYAKVVSKSPNNSNCSTPTKSSSRPGAGDAPVVAKSAKTPSPPKVSEKGKEKHSEKKSKIAKSEAAQPSAEAQKSTETVQSVASDVTKQSVQVSKDATAGDAACTATNQVQEVGPEVSLAKEDTAVPEELSASKSDQAAEEANNYATSDAQSVGSSDSGKGASEADANLPGTAAASPQPEPSMAGTSAGSGASAYIVYQFELPSMLCGRLIGRSGHFVNSIKQKCSANIVVSNHPLSADAKICTVEGYRDQIREALQLIRARFPANQFPEVTLQQINAINPLNPMDKLNCVAMPLPKSCQLPLAHGVSNDVILSSLVSAGHFFLQQPTQPTYPALHRLDQIMALSYATNEAPGVPNPSPGMIVAVPMLQGWYRAVINRVYSNGNESECDVKFVDYGGQCRIHVNQLRQIRVDFMTLPFQASECFLAGVCPSSEAGWSAEANQFFEELAQGQILQATVVACSEDGTYFVDLYKIQGASTIYINEELVKNNFAQWIPRPKTN